MAGAEPGAKRRWDHAVCEARNHPPPGGVVDLDGGLVHRVHVPKYSLRFRRGQLRVLLDVEDG